jgi:hypothetical protein
MMHRTELAGKYMIFSLPTKIAKRLTSQDNRQIMQLHDQVFELYHQLRGSKVSAEIRRRYQPSIQIQEGAAATAVCSDSGCVIDQYMDSYSSIDTPSNQISPLFLNLTYVTSIRQLVNNDFSKIWGLWGILHEFGTKIRK